MLAWRAAAVAAIVLKTEAGVEVVAR